MTSPQRYRIKTVAEMTGIPRNTLLAWERRHGLLSPERLENGYRLYSDEDVAILRRVKAAISSGMAISEALRAVRTEPGRGEGPHAVPDLPAAVEVAAYRIVCEGLTNVVRHAGAASCRVTLDLDRDGALSVLVDDDGAGVAVGDRPGMGLRSMRERATELGGSCRLSRSPMGGTRVCARLPVAGAPPVEQASA